MIIVRAMVRPVPSTLCMLPPSYGGAPRTPLQRALAEEPDPETREGVERVIRGEPPF
jgi:hypothetical protein